MNTRTRCTQVAAVLLLLLATVIPTQARADDHEALPPDPAPKTPLEACERTRDSQAREIEWWAAQYASLDELHEARVADSELLAQVAAQWQHRVVAQAEEIRRLEAKVARLRAKLQARR